MEAVWIVLGLGMSAAAWAFRRSQLDKLARQLGLERKGSSLVGQIDGLQVELSQSDKKNICKVRNPAIPSTLGLKREDVFTRALAHDILTGDPVFDEAVLVTGKVEEVLAVLDHTTRARALDHVSLGAVIQRQQVERAIARLSDVADELPDLVVLAERLALPQGSAQAIPERLAARVASDPLVTAQVHALRVLIETYPDSRACHDTCHRTLGAASAELRLEAAGHLTSRGGDDAPPEALDVLAILAGDPDQPDPVRISALASLSSTSDVDRARAPLEAALTNGSEAVQRVAIVSSGKVLGADTIPRLDAIADQTSAGPAEALAGVLRSIAPPGDAQAQACLLRLLARDDRGVRLRAIQALGVVGDVRAVEPLGKLRGRFGLGRESNEAEQAIAKIQSRLGDVAPGRLSLAVPDALDGALSHTPGDASGGLSAEGEAGGAMQPPDVR